MVEDTLFWRRLKGPGALISVQEMSDACSVFLVSTWPCPNSFLTAAFAATTLACPALAVKKRHHFSDNTPAPNQATVATPRALMIWH